MGRFTLAVGRFPDIVTYVRSEGHPGNGVQETGQAARKEPSSGRYGEMERDVAVCIAQKHVTGIAAAGKLGEHRAAETAGLGK